MSTRRASLLALAAALLAGCGGGGGNHGSGSSPKITAQPSATTAAVGGTATFSVVAEGSNLTYQWYRNDGAIEGATGPSYTTPVLTEADGGATFYVVVKGGSKSTKSGVVTLTLGATGTPSITSQPANAVAPVGGSASFGVVATGEGLTYQWYKGETAISGATEATYTLSPVTAADVATYHVVVTSSTGQSVTSGNATLTIGAVTAPTISSQPRSGSVVVGGRVTLSVAASGSGTLTYQWYRIAPGGTVGAAIPGATRATYTSGALTAANDGDRYYVVVSGSGGSTTSASATIAVVAAPTITDQPESQSVFVGANVTFSVTATGSGLSYQWTKDGTPIPGAKSPTYVVPTATEANAGLYRVIVTNSAGSVASTPVRLTVNGAPTITDQPDNAVAATGSTSTATTATFTVVATGAGTVTYQWYRIPAGSSSTTGTAISGATSASYTTPVVTSANNGDKYYVNVSNPGGTTKSGTVTLTVDAPPTISTQPTSISVVAPATATFTVAATASNASSVLTYKWFRNGVEISGATGASYTTPATTVAADNGTTYFVRVYADGIVYTQSGTVTLTVTSS